MSSFPTAFPPSTATPLRGGPVLRWGILAPGTIAGDFVTTLHAHSDQRAVAVGSRSAERAERFAARHGIERSYGSYEQLVDDPAIDVVYVASPHSEHKRLALLAIAAGKHVLVEKPMALDAAEAREIAAAASVAGVFAMEAMWSRYLPQTTVIDTLIRDGVLGDVKVVTADFGGAPTLDPASRLFDPALGGGALLDLGVYPIWFSHFALGAPASVIAAGRLAFTGVDGQVSMILTGEGGGQSLLSTSLFAATPVTATVSGSLARVEIDSTFVSPGGFTLRGKDGESLRWQDETGFVWRDGLVWQATGVAQHIADGLTESPLHPLSTTISVLETVDEARRQLAAAQR